MRYLLVGLALASTLITGKGEVDDDYTVCMYLDHVDTHYDVIVSFSPLVAYDALAYPLEIWLPLDKMISSLEEC